MYLYRTKHKVLTAINDEIVKGRHNPLDFVMCAKDILDNTPPFLNKEKRIAMALSSLSAQGYVKYTIGKRNGYPGIFMTKEGTNALSNWDFIKKQNNLVAVITRDSLLVITAVAVAIGTFYAIVKSDEINNVKAETQQLKELLHTQGIEQSNQERRLTRIEDSLTK